MGPYIGGCDRCDCHLPRGTRVARCSSCMYDVCFRCQEEACLVVRNTFLSFDEPKERPGRQRTRTEPCELGCTYADSADNSTDGATDDESECSTDGRELDVGENGRDLSASVSISREPDASPISCVSDHSCKDGDCRESNEAQVVVRNTFLD